MEIKKLKNTDSLSESMNTINTNFEILSRIDEGDKQRWEKYINGLDGKVKTLIDAIDSKNIELSEQIEHIGDMFNKVPNMDDLQHQVSIAISDVNSELGNAIKNISAGAAGIQVENKMGDYAKTTYVNNALSNYTTSVAFEDYKSDSKNKTASANSIVANSKFYTTDDGYFVLLTGTKSGYKNLSEYYNDLETADKNEIDPDGKGLSDPDVLNRFITHCEQKFKTVSTELAGFSAKVAEDMAELDILAQISNDDGKKISAAIITQANELGSSIKLNADHLNLTGENLVINTDNFQVNTDGSGTVVVKGAIEATSLILSPSSSASSQFSSLVASVGNSLYTTPAALDSTLSTYVQTTTFGTTLENYATKSDLSTVASGYDTWLTKAFSKTEISGGLVLTGNVLVMDASNNPTAGMMGATTSGNDLRFFAGSTDLSSAPFRVYEDGSLFASNATITGKIIATELEISPSSSAASTFSNLVESIGNNLYTTPDYLDSTLSTYVQTTTFGTTLASYATKSFVSNAVASVSSYDDDWLMKAFNKTTISAGLVLTGNVVTMDASSNPTAGMMGATTSSNDLRFFAGSADLSTAPFRVYKDGSLYASNAHITGEITATSLTIGSSASSTFNSLVQNAVSNAGYVNNSVLSSILSTYVETTTFGTTLENYATISDLSSVASYPDGWLTNAFDKTSINGGLALTGNIFAVDSNSHITAGMMGATTSGNDLRFFAGSDSTNAATAPFRVYEDGSFYAEKANISGVINRYFKITSSNWQEYATQIGEKDGQPYYVIDLNKIKKNIEITYIPPVPGGVGLIFDVRTPSITSDMVGMELNVLNFIPKKTIHVGHSMVDYYTTGNPPTNAAVIRPANNDKGYVGGNTNSDVGTFQCMRLIAIELPDYSGSGSQYAWLRTDSYSVYQE